MNPFQYCCTAWPDSSENSRPGNEQEEQQEAADDRGRPDEPAVASRDLLEA